MTRGESELGEDLLGTTGLVACLAPRLLVGMLAKLFAHTISNLDKFILSFVVVGMCKEGIPVQWINVPEHGAPQMADVVRLEQPLPPTEPLVILGVQDEHFRTKRVIFSRSR